MRAAAFEVVGIARAENAAFVIHCHLQAAGEHDAAFLSFMHQWHLAGIGARLVALLQNLQAAAEEVFADLPIGNGALADFDQFLRRIEGLFRRFRFEGEEFGKSDRDAVENAFQRTDGWIGRIGFDQRDRRIGNAGTLGEFTLG